ncbi:MAG: DUF2239 family protein [Pseudomonadota bacterium]
MTQYTAFENFQVVARGDMAAMIAAQRAALPRGVNLLIYDDETGHVRDVDLRKAPPPQRGRPKIGVKAREVTLLPRHWAWLSDQKGGASAALRTLVDDAMWAQGSRRSDAARQKTAYAFLSSIAGDLPRFEAMSRALFASDWEAFVIEMTDWPGDVRAYAMKLANVSG